MEQYKSVQWYQMGAVVARVVMLPHCLVNGEHMHGHDTY